MMIPRIIDTFLRESPDPTKGFNYCCCAMQGLLLGEASPIQLSIHTHKLVLMGSNKEGTTTRFHVTDLNFCPCCGEEITYDD